MLGHKHIVKIVSALMILALTFCLLLLAFSEKLLEKTDVDGISMEYEEKLFDTSSIISVNIIMDEDDWNEMLENAIEEKYYECDVEINGETFYKVGIRPKGNTSLSSIANDSTTNRYSFKLEFDHYVEGQTCYGLDKLILNNNYADATNMKEALIYDMYQFLGVDASLYNYAGISVNGEYWGLYLALEGVEDSFALRNYGTEDGLFYKPESTEMGGGGEGDSSNGNSANGADLNYSDEDEDSYSAIWEGALSDVTDADKKRLITALKNISEGNDLEDYMDIENLLSYMAVHVFSVNEDSLSGRMAHNYYLYESKGKLNLIPWDYNLCLGGMDGAADATDLVNDPIDNAFSGTEFFDTLLEDEEYHSQYYACLEKLVEEYIEGGGFDAFYNRVRSQIDELVESDPTAFYSYSEYEEAADTLYQVVKLRGESIQGQLDGSISSTEEERMDTDSLIDASDLDISLMGGMNQGGGGQGQMGPKELGDGMNEDAAFGENQAPQEGDGMSPDGNMPSFEEMESSDAAGSGPGQGMPGGGDPGEKQMPENMGKEGGGNREEGQAPQDTGKENGGNQEEKQMPQEGGEMRPDGNMPSFEEMESGDAVSGNADRMDPGENADQSIAIDQKTLLLCGASLLLMVGALVFALVYRRKPKRKKW